MKQSILLLSLLLSTASLAIAASPATETDITEHETTSETTPSHTIYQTTLPDGSVEFSDSPNQPGAKAIEVKAPQSVKLPKASSYPSIEPSQSEANTKVYSHISITKPEADTHFRNHTTPIQIKIVIKPSLAKEHLIRVTHNGTTIDEKRSLSFVIPTLNPGSHTLTASVIDGSGNVLASSSSVIFFHHKTTTLNRASP